MPDTYPSFQFVDTHCHIDLYQSPPSIIEEIETNSVLSIAVTNAPFLFENTQKLSTQSNLVIAALGLHPELVATHGDQLVRFHQLLKDTRFVGEVGLDYVTKDAGNRQQQRVVFESILAACAEAGDKILTIHSRRSAPDVVSMIGDAFPGTPILHWYSGARRDLRKAIAAGCYFSVNTAMVRSENGQQLISEIPADRLLTETDGPFAKHERNPATPASVSAVVDSLAAILNKSREDIRQTVHRSALNAFGWAP